MKIIKYWPAIIIALLFGFIGFQEFYIGNLIRGILAIIFCWTFIPSIVAFVQICKWLYIGEEEFNKKYNDHSDSRTSKKYGLLYD